MDNNPIDTGGFTHWLNFKSLGFTELYEITEPPGFDVANLLIKQREEGFGRDIIYGNEQANETYYDACGFERRNTQQVIHPNGTTSHYLDLGFNWILETWKRFGYEGEIERILKKDGVTFTVGIFDMANPDTDGFSYFGCNVIQNTTVSNYKKQLDSSVDVLATRNIKDEPITPAPTLKFLRKALPITDQSQWGKSQNVPGGVNIQNDYFICFNRNIVLNGLNNTLTSSYDVLFDTFGTQRAMTFAQHAAGGFDYTNVADGTYMKLFKAKKFTKNISINIRLKGSCQWRFPSPSGTAKLFYFVMIADEGTFHSQFYGGNYTEVLAIPVNTSGIIDIDENVTLVLPFDIPMDKTLYGAFTTEGTKALTVSVQESLLTITASEVSLDTVISGVRYIDMIKQCSKFINDKPVDAAIYDYGGEHYDNVCYNRALLSLETSNSLELINDTTPPGSEIGEVVQNTNDSITGVLPLGYYFWNGSIWIALSGDIADISLTDSSTPAGSFEGDLAYNTNTSVAPVGLCYWNGSHWISIQYNRPFLTTIKDCFENAMTIEECADYEIQQEKIVFKPYQGFYTNTEIASFLIAPGKDYKVYPNERFKLNNIKIAFDTFETNRLSKNTANDIHTEGEWSNPNVYVENKFERGIAYIRSGYSAQAMVDLNTKTPATADDNDDKVFITKIVPLPEGSFKKFSARLKISLDGTTIRILNRDSEGDANDIVFVWIELGLTVGDNFEITEGENVGVYSISSFTATEIFLIPVSITPTFSGDADITMKYYLSGILWQTKTDEGYTLIEGLENPHDYPNLDYSLRHIFDNWGQYFASAGVFHPDKKIKKLKFTNNPALKTQIGSGPVLTEIEDIPISSLPTPILGPNCHDLEIGVGFSQMLDLMAAYFNDRGFIRFYTLGGQMFNAYPKETDYTLKTGRYAPKLEEKFEPAIVTLVYSDGEIEVNDVPYSLEGNLDWWKITGDYFQCFDENSGALCNIRHYSKVNLNGVVYESADELEDALLVL